MTEPLYLSQTMLKSWESDCRLAFSKHFFGSDEEREIFNIEKAVFDQGIYFETLAVGSGRDGKIGTSDGMTKLISGRIEQQAKLYREWERANGFKSLGSDVRIRERIEWDGGVYLSEGHLDRIVKDGEDILIIDTKLTGNSSSTYGKWSWGDAYKVDLTQLTHYKILAEMKFGKQVRQMFYVADISLQMRVKPLEYPISDWEIQMHHERCQTAYNEIMQAKIGDWFEPSPSYDNCSNCPMAEICKYRIKIPEIKLIER